MFCKSRTEKTEVKNETAEVVIVQHPVCAQLPATSWEESLGKFLYIYSHFCFYFYWYLYNIRNILKTWLNTVPVHAMRLKRVCVTMLCANVTNYTTNNEFRLLYLYLFQLFRSAKLANAKRADDTHMNKYPSIYYILVFCCVLK